MVRTGLDGIRRPPRTPRPLGQPSLPSSPCPPGHYGREGCGPGRAAARFGGAGAQRRRRRSGSGALGAPSLSPAASAPSQGGAGTAALSRESRSLSDPALNG
ncbi:hypothetical protein Nmel_008911 [Mimus melanotis]